MGGDSSGGVGIRKALVIQFASKYANVLVQLLLTAVLARILSPSQYGTVAIVTVFTSFFSILADVGVAPAVVQFKDLDDNDLSGLLAFSALLGAVSAFLFCLAAYPISLVYSDPSLINLCRFASLSIFFNSADMVPNGILLRDKRFVSVGVRLLVTTIVSGVVAIFLAIAGFGAYSLVIQSVLLSVGVFAWNMASSHVKVGNIHFMPPLKRVLSYSLFQAGFTTVNYFSRNLDNMLIGSIEGASALGFYDKAYKLTTYPISFLASIVGSVLQPYLSKYQNDKEAMCEKWLSVAKLLSLLAAPVAALMICASKELVMIMFGDQWGDAVPLFQVLAVSVYFQVVNNPTGAIFQSSGRTDYMFFHSLISTGMTLVLLLLGLFSGGVLGAAVGVSCAYCLHTISLLYFLVYRTLSARPIAFAVHFLPEVFVAVVSCSLCLLLSGWFPEATFASLIAKGLVLVAAFGTGYVLTGQATTLLSAIKK